MTNSNKPPQTPILDQHYPKRGKLKAKKKWIISTTRSGWENQKRANELLEQSYHRLIASVKKDYSQSEERYFERDYKYDQDEGYLAMHCFLTPTFYVYLECDLALNYHIEYAFNNCPYERKVRREFEHFTFGNAIKEVELKPDFKTFYKRTLEYNDL